MLLTNEFFFKSYHSIETSKEIKKLALKIFDFCFSSDIADLFRLKYEKSFIKFQPLTKLK